MNHPKKKIAFLGIKGLPSKGGADRVVEAIANNLSEEFDISVYGSHSCSKDFQSDDIKLIKVKNLRGKHLSSFSLFLLSSFHALICKNFDLVHVHNTDAGFIIPLLRLKYKVIATSHGYPYKRDKWNYLAKRFLKFSEALFFQNSSVITCVSKSISEELNGRYNKDIHFIPNGIDKPYIEEQDYIIEELGLEDKEFLCFAAGRVDPTKGCHILLQALNRINRNISVVAIGDFSHKKDYSKKLFQMADERVKFVPFIEDKKDLFGIIKRAKLFVFPSTVEAMSMMLLEVAALGVPIICSDIPENTSVLEDRTIYFKSEDVKDLIEKIEFCLDNYNTISERAVKTKQWVTERYNWKNIVNKYKNIYIALAQ